MLVSICYTAIYMVRVWLGSVRAGMGLEWHDSRIASFPGLTDQKLEPGKFWEQG